MAEVEHGKLTGFGKLVTVVAILALLGLGAWVVMRPKTSTSPAAGGATSSGAPAGTSTAGTPPPAPPAPPPAPGALEGIVDTQAGVPKLDPPAVHPLKDNTLVLEVSEYAGYSGIIVANGGLEPNEDSIFYKKHGFKLKITLSEDEDWSDLINGKLSASVTTADVLALYGRQFRVAVPLQIGFSRGADGIVVLKEITRINALKGRVLVTGQFSEAEFFLRYLSQEAGLGVHAMPSPESPVDPEKVNLLFCEDAFAAGDLFLKEVKAGRTFLAGCVTWAPKTSEVVEGSGGRARLLTTNRNLLIIADLLVVNRGFAEQNPSLVAGLVQGILEGNRKMRENPGSHLGVVAAAFKWTVEEAREEYAKVHLSNLPENLAFFSGAIDAAGSFGSVYQSAVLAYGSVIRDPVDGEQFLDLRHLKALEASGQFRDQRIEIAPIRSASAAVETHPLLSKDIRFLFEANSAALDLKDEGNLKNLEAIRKLLQVSPGSTILLRGHVDDALVPEFRKKGGEPFVRQMALRAMELSKNRAAEIKKHLIEKHKVDPARLDTVGRGWEEPTSKTSPEQNRRVEVQWFTVE